MAYLYSTFSLIETTYGAEPQSVIEEPADTALETDKKQNSPTSVQKEKANFLAGKLYIKSVEYEISETQISDSSSYEDFAKELLEYFRSYQTRRIEQRIKGGNSFDTMVLRMKENGSEDLSHIVLRYFGDLEAEFDKYFSSLMDKNGVFQSKAAVTDLLVIELALKTYEELAATMIEKLESSEKIKEGLPKARTKNKQQILVDGGSVFSVDARGAVLGPWVEEVSPGVGIEGEQKLGVGIEQAILNFEVIFRLIDLELEALDRMDNVLKSLDPKEDKKSHYEELRSMVSESMVEKICSKHLKKETAGCVEDIPRQPCDYNPILGSGPGPRKPSSVKGVFVSEGSKIETFYLHLFYGGDKVWWRSFGALNPMYKKRWYDRHPEGQQREEESFLESCLHLLSGIANKRPGANISLFDELLRIRDDWTGFQALKKAVYEKNSKFFEGVVYSSGEISSKFKEQTGEDGKIKRVVAKIQRFTIDDIELTADNPDYLEDSFEGPYVVYQNFGLKDDINSMKSKEVTNPFIAGVCDVIGFLFNYGPDYTVKNFPTLIITGGLLNIYGCIDAFCLTIQDLKTMSESLFKDSKAYLLEFKDHWLWKSTYELSLQKPLIAKNFATYVKVMNFINFSLRVFIQMPFILASLQYAANNEQFYVALLGYVYGIVLKPTCWLMRKLT